MPGVFGTPESSEAARSSPVYDDAISRFLIKSTPASLAGSI